MRTLALAVAAIVTGCATPKTKNLPPLAVEAIHEAPGLQQQAICNKGT